MWAASPRQKARAAVLKCLASTTDRAELAVNVDAARGLERGVG